MKYKGAYSKFIKLLDILSKEWQGGVPFNFSFWTGNFY